MSESEAKPKSEADENEEAYSFLGWALHSLCRLSRCNKAFRDTKEILRSLGLLLGDLSDEG
jgi:hypothetical protein